jgi:hypothetical protein
MRLTALWMKKWVGHIARMSVMKSAHTHTHAHTHAHTHTHTHTCKGKGKVHSRTGHEGPKGD